MNINMIEIIQTWEFTTIEMLAQYTYAALILLLFIFGMDLLTRYRRADKRSREDPVFMTFFVISIALIGYALYNIPAMLVYFYGYEAGWQLAFQQICVAIILFPFAVVSDKILMNQKHFKYFFTLIGIILLLYLLVLMFIYIFLPGVILLRGGLIYEFLPVFFLYAIIGISGIISMLKILVINLKPFKSIRMKIFLTLFIGLITFVISMVSGFYRGKPGTTVNPAYFWYRLIYLILWILMRYVLTSIPSYSEFDWKNGLYELYIMHSESGLLVYSCNLHNMIQNIGENARVDGDLVSGGIVGIKTMLNEIAGERGSLKHIEIGQKHLIFTSGNGISCFLLCEKNLGVYYAILQNLTHTIERTYPRLIQFDGNLENIAILPIVEKTFDISG